MDNVYKLIFVFLLIFSGSVFADTYTAPVHYRLSSVSPYAFYGNGQAACDSVGYAPGLFYGAYGNGYACNFSNGNLYDYVQSSSYCPAGGTLSGTSCINAPACTSGQYRNATTGACTTPVFCLYPEVDDGTGHCAVPAECPTGKKYQYSSLSCQTPPTCGFTETFNAYTWQCELKQVPCPVHSHLNTARDKCLVDAPLTCPIGQHDDGTYTCVANDAVACTSDQVKGYINGIPQCIKKTQTEDNAKSNADAQTAKKAADAAAAAAKATADAAAAALAADPSNQSKIDANNAAIAALNAATADSLSKTTAADLAQKAEDTANLKSISESVKEINDRQIQADKDGFGTIPTPDVIPETSVSMPSLPTYSTLSCPAPYTLQLHGTAISMSYQPYCDFASMIKPLVLASAYLAGALMIMGSFRD